MIFNEDVDVVDVVDNDGVNFNFQLHLLELWQDDKSGWDKDFATSE